MTDAGAKFVLDFTHAGFPSTCRIAGPEQVDFIVDTLITHLSVARMDIIVLEVLEDWACRSYQRVDPKIFAKIVDAIVFTPSDAMSAIAGAEIIKHQRLPLTAIGRTTD